MDGSYFFLKQKGFSLDKETDYNPFYNKHPRRQGNKQDPKDLYENFPSFQTHLQLPSSHGWHRQQPAQALTGFHEEAKSEFTAARTGDPPPPLSRNLSIERTSITSSPRPVSTRSAAASSTTSSWKNSLTQPAKMEQPPKTTHSPM
jgi:hypothetical protein